jgi:hypothetical protein
MPCDSSASGLDEELLAAFHAANPGVTNPTRKALRAFMKRDFEAIMARLDTRIAESNARLDRIFQTLANGPA